MRVYKDLWKGWKLRIGFLVIMLFVMLIITMIPTKGTGRVYAAQGDADDPIQVSSWDELYNACVNAPDNVSTKHSAFRPYHQDYKY